MEKALNNILSSSGKLLDLVGQNISPIRRDDQVNSVSYERTGREQQRFATGQACGMIQSEFLITCRGETYAKAKDISASVINAVDGVSGIHFGETIHLSRLNSEQQSQVYDEKITEITLDFTIYHN